MLKICILYIFHLSLFSVSANGQSILDTATRDPSSHLISHDKALSLVSDSLQYPPAAKAAGVEGAVYVAYKFDANGKIDSAYVVRGVRDDMDKEALRLIKLLDHFDIDLPRDSLGNLVPLQYTMPLKFKLY